MLQIRDLVITIPIGNTTMLTENYQLGDDFFKLFEGSLIQQGELSVRVELTKTLHHTQLRFLVGGTVKLSCDRTLDLFDYPIIVEHTVHFKLGPAYKELALDLYVIDEQRPNIALAQHIYDFVHLAIPMKKLHPRFNSEEEADYTTNL